MNTLLRDLKISINEGIYLKDPQSTDLGRRIIQHSIELIDEIGFEDFTFRKLGNRIKSNESSLYRYFENKHKLLVYLTSWYWGWKEYQLVFTTNSISDPKNKLIKAIEVLSEVVKEDDKFEHINEVSLNNIIINDSAKSFLTKNVDKENKEGYFQTYKRLVNRLREMILEVNPKYPYPSSLASNIIDGSIHQHFIITHFKSLHEYEEYKKPSDFFVDMVDKILN
ncbi:transcriptional regulator, TetR family [Zhouia amylolytica]|uniref:Transcriptional regulator, TetR family n=1 Tax=Zhouia amylolytica TaxID=376730 RepID=A0A1I6V4P4_9FLAO|nr:TetR/AcrR family transcriptional regulator [Zhouia amylolytica]MCQ0110034.1 TetR/AcrR family transcriptional regulator [Zhouia amylolytica]SFT08642.1 transcriptional regulator, TetR family [Zhouia amylolytica]